MQQLQCVIEEKKKQLTSSSAQLRESLRNEPKEEKDNFVKVCLFMLIRGSVHISKDSFSSDWFLRFLLKVLFIFSSSIVLFYELYWTFGSICSFQVMLCVRIDA